MTLNVVSNITDNLMDFLHRFIGFLQETGIHFMILIAILGLMLFLLAGNSPIIKRAGLVTGIVFGIGSLLAAYIPVLMYYFAGDRYKREAVITGIVKDSSTEVQQVFSVLFELTVPITVTLILIGLMVRGLGSTNPKKKRKGIGMILSSSLILFLVYAVPKLIVFL